ncbi:hypothetical protein H4R33_001570 [Dimargaris cristalligena]|nr:hypothetical protein H4R33_001570 [Dimargaris cristalligena]
MTHDIAVVEQVSRLIIDTKLLGNFGYHLGSTLMLIGDVEELEDKSNLPDMLRQSSQKCTPIVRARIARCADGLDLSLYQTALDIRRDFEKQWSEARV